MKNIITSLINQFDGIRLFHSSEKAYLSFHKREVHDGYYQDILNYAKLLDQDQIDKLYLAYPEIKYYAKISDAVLFMEL